MGPGASDVDEESDSDAPEQDDGIVSVKDIDRGWKRIRAQLLKAGGAFTKVGVQEGERRDDGTDLVTVAAVNEFGAPKKKIPERSFIRSTTDEQRQKVERMKRRILEGIADGTMTIKRGLGLLGEFMESKIKDKIVRLDTPPNAPSTIARKGSSNPLVDKGQLLQSIRHVEVLP
jgi:hypothetical protein